MQNLTTNVSYMVTDKEMLILTQNRIYYYMLLITICIFTFDLGPFLKFGSSSCIFQMHNLYIANEYR